MYKRFIGIFISLLFFMAAGAQIRGVVVDADDGYGVPYASIFFPNLHHSITTDGEGKFELPRHVGNAIVVSCVGYVKQHVTLDRATDSITVKLKPQSIALTGVTVKSHRKRYSRKNNPAVELMRKVIARKKETNLLLKPYYSYQKYQKITLSENQVDTVKHKRKAWFRNQVEKSPLDTTKLILPLMVNEQITKHLYRRDPKRDLDVIEAKRS
ncbi:MAG: carboxypeptidase-like regulatory domain-containing protein, partial [Prevotella sp.]